VKPLQVLRRVSVDEPPHPVYVVWELTLKCDQHCSHCGSRAADARPNELTTAEALAVVPQLQAMGTREVVVIGGEAYLHPGFLEIVAALKAAGIRPCMTTGGRGLTAELARDMASAGMYATSISIDGLETTHDLIRASAGSFRAAIEGFGHLRAAKIRPACNTNLNRLSAPELEGIYEFLLSQGVQGWQIQPTAPLGRAADRPELLLQPWDLLDLVPRVIEIKKRGFRDGMTVMPGNNLGYFGPEETILRSVEEGGHDYFRGCGAGKFVMGIESDGAVKGCPSLQTAHYVGGNVRQDSVRDIWEKAPELSFTRRRTLDDLWGFCRTCDFAEACMGGCSFTAHGFFGRTGNNPYCHYRARTFAKQGLRERLVPKERAPGKPFDNGRFDLVIEPLDAPDAQPERPAHRLKVWSGPSLETPGAAGS
jgi:radical SAM protein with 4Fe4S-binding SPASM domain